MSPEPATAQESRATATGPGPHRAPQEPSAEDPVLVALGALIDDAQKALDADDPAGARECIARAIERALSELKSREDDPLLDLVWEMGTFAHDVGALRPAEQARRKLVEIKTRTKPDDDPDLQGARGNLAATLYFLGDLDGARSIQEKVLEVSTRTLSGDDPELQLARGNLAATLAELGDLRGARTLEEKVLEVLSRTLPDDDPDLLLARSNLAGTILQLGDLQGAKELLATVLEIRSRTLPDDDPALQTARNNLAATIFRLGDIEGARALLAKVLEVRSRALPDDHPDVQMSRSNLAVMIAELGDIEGARALQEKVLEVDSRRLPDDHPDLQMWRQNLAGTLRELGDLQGARALEERVLAVRVRTLPDDHPDLQLARNNLAATIRLLGDFQGARALQEKVLEVRSRALPEDHPDLQQARNNLAATMVDLGDLESARALLEKALDVGSRAHSDVQWERQNLAFILYTLGDLQRARALLEEILEDRSRTLPDEHPDLLQARGNLAVTIKALGDLQGARVLEEKVLEVCARTLPDEHPALQLARLNLVRTIAAESTRVPKRDRALDKKGETRRERCVELIGAMCRSQISATRDALLARAPREAEALSQSMSHGLSTALSVAIGIGGLPPAPELDEPSFVLSETTRGAALSSAALMRYAAGSPRYAELRSELNARSRELAALAERGTTSEEFHQVLARREAIERELVALAGELSGESMPALEIDISALAARLAESDALVAYRRFERSTFTVRDDAAASEPLRESPRESPREVSTDSLCAFVLRRVPQSADGSRVEARLVHIDLGPIEPIERAVHAWRGDVGSGSGRGVGVSVDVSTAADSQQSGDALRRLVFDPLANELAGATRVIVVLDDVLHLVPFDALPRDVSSRELLGDRLRVETRATVVELTTNPRERKRTETLVAGGNVSTETLVAVGDVSFDATEVVGAVTGLDSRVKGSGSAESPPALATLDTSASASESEGAIESARQSRGLPSLRRDANSAVFQPLPATGAEIDALAASYAEHAGTQGDVSLLRGSEATRERLIQAASGARWMHVATHGWFAPESIASWRDIEPLDKFSGLGLRASGQDLVKGMSPMLLCGLALAGANLPDNDMGRARGLITAEEIAALDLTSCELAVLSACDTNVGVSENRAGQGVASLQMGLQMAGARSVITSLWKVPDEATKDLMIDFYRRLWVEKRPKWQALWEAKKALREARDERGGAKYSTRDWAAWVLTGDSN